MTAPRRALVLVDVQRDYVDGGPLHIQHPDPTAALHAITTAIDTATAAGLPVAVVQHTSGEHSPVFNPTRPGYDLHPDVARRRTPAWKHVVKQHSSVFAHTDLHDWLTAQDVDTVTLVGFMTNNCVLASAVDTERLGLTAEVLADATGTVHLADDAGHVDAATLHAVLLTLLQSNWAAVTDTASWQDALRTGTPLPKDNLVVAALAGAAHATANAHQRPGGRPVELEGQLAP